MRVIQQPQRLTLHSPSDEDVLLDWTQSHGEVWGLLRGQLSALPPPNLLVAPSPNVACYMPH